MAVPGTGPTPRSVTLRREPWLVVPVPPRWLVLLSVAILTALGSGWLGAAWAADAGTARVTLLGSGRTLSVLVTAGPARLLIAAGDDPGAFARALEAARRPTTARLDVLVLAGQGDDLAVPASAFDRLGARSVVALLPPTGRAMVDEPGLGDVPPLGSPRRVRVDGSVTVTFETAETGDGDARRSHWRATVERGATRVVIVSSGEATAEFPSPGPLSALVVAGAGAPGALAAWPAPALAVNTAEVEGRDLRQEVVPLAPAGVWAVRVFPGTAVPLDLGHSGLVLPPASSQFLQPTPRVPPAVRSDGLAASRSGT